MSDAINMRDGVHRTQPIKHDQMTYADFWCNWGTWLDVLQAQQLELLCGDHRSKPWAEYMWANRKASEIQSDIMEVSLLIERSNAWTPQHNAS